MTHLLVVDRRVATAALRHVLLVGVLTKEDRAAATALAPRIAAAAVSRVCHIRRIGVAYGRPHAGAHKQRGTRGRAVAARARAKSGPETAISEQNLTSIKIQEGTPLDELNSGTPAARNRSGPSSAAARCHGRPGPGPGGAAAQPNVGTCEICSTFATLLQKLQHTRLTARRGDDHTVLSGPFRPISLHSRGRRGDQPVCLSCWHSIYRPRLP